MPEDKSNVVRIDLGARMHPGQIRGDGPAAEIARKALGTLNATAAEINDAAPQIESKRRLAEVVVKISEKAIGRLDAAAAKVQHHVKTHTDAINAALAAPCEANIAAQVRAHVGSQQSPFTYALTAIKEGDPRVASAILGAPSMLSGITTEQAGLLRRAAAEHYAPDAVKALATAEHSLAKLLDARDGYTDLMAPKIRAWAGDDNDRLAKLANKAGGDDA